METRIKTYVEILKGLPEGSHAADMLSEEAERLVVEMIEYRTIKRRDPEGAIMAILGLGLAAMFLNVVFVSDIHWGWKIPIGYGGLVLLVHSPRYFVACLKKAKRDATGRVIQNKPMKGTTS